MSRTYQALKKAEAEQRAGHAAPPPGPGSRLNGAPNGRSGRHAAPSPAAGVSSREQMELQKIRLWLANAARRGEPLHSLMVVGCRSGTGTTTTASLLATALAEANDTRVLLIDANLRTPALTSVFGLQTALGLSDVAFRGATLEQCIEDDIRPRLSVLGSGRLPPSSNGLFDDHTLDGVISRLKERYTLLVFDCAPILDFPDGRGIAPKVDGVILVVSADTTSVQDAQEAKRDLEQAGGKIVGVIFNREADLVPRLFRPFLRRRRAASRLSVQAAATP